MRITGLITGLITDTSGAFCRERHRAASCGSFKTSGSNLSLASMSMPSEQANPQAIRNPIPKEVDGRKFHSQGTTYHLPAGQCSESHPITQR